MKDLSHFFLKNPLSSKIKRHVRNSCNDVTSTTTMNQTPSESTEINPCKSPRTLEDMLLQLDMEEAAARREKLDEYGELNRRMSCANVDTSGALGSVRAELARLSLDGRTSVRNYCYINLEGGRGCGGFYGGRTGEVKGERVVWCRPGVVARLMGLDVVPVPVRCGWKGRRGRFEECRRRNMRRMGRCELEKFRLMEFPASKNEGGCGGGGRGRMPL